MDKLTRRAHEAARLRRKTEARQQAETQSAAINDAFRQGHTAGNIVGEARGRLAVQPLDAVMEPFMAEARHWFADALARQAMEAMTVSGGSKMTPPQVIFQAASAAWDYMTTEVGHISAQGLDGLVRTIARRHYMRNELELELSMPPLRFARKYDPLDLELMRASRKRP